MSDVNHDLKKNGYKIFRKLHKMETSRGAYIDARHLRAEKAQYVTILIDRILCSI